MEFRLSDQDKTNYRKWLKDHNETCPIQYEGAIGGKISFHFTPTGLGPVIKITCDCGEELDLTDVESW